MRCKNVVIVLAGLAVFVQTAGAQEIPAAAPTLQAPGTANRANPTIANSTAAPTSATNIVTLGQAARSAAPATPAPAPGAASNGAAPPIVPAIQGNAVLATGSNAKLLDSAAPTNEEAQQRIKALPDISLVRVSESDNELRALLKVHGVARHVEVGSKVKKFVVQSITDEGVCLVDLAQQERLAKKKHSINPTCTQLISFQR